MTEYEIVKRLEYCLNNQCDICQEENGSGFPWVDGRCYGFTERMCDALALLKAQQPRVMTFQEVQSADIVWIEQADVIIPAIKIYTYLDGSGTMSFAYPYHDYHGLVNVVNIRPCDYGKISRCWTQKPTPEQREAVKWDG